MTRKNINQGMTLVEVLAGLIILSILALVSLQYLGIGLTSSANTMGYVKDQENISSVIERITVNYNKLIKSNSTPLATLKTSIGNQGTSQTNTFGTYQVIQNSYIVFNSAYLETADNVSLAALKVKIRVGSRQFVSIFTN
jgi:prepilin-type N-terminal cleavage/methylation domain-containing protein